MKIYLWDYGLENLSHLERSLSLKEVEYLRTVKSPKRQKEFAAGRALTRWIIEHEAAMDSLPLQFCLTPSGKPSVFGGPAFNLSHSVNRILFSLTCDGASVGADIEKEVPDRSVKGLLDKIATPREILNFNHLSNEQATSSFFKLWVLKEAFVKQSGLGIGHGRLNEFDFDIKGSKWKTQGDLCEFKFVYFNQDKYHGAICIPAAHFKEPQLFSVFMKNDEFLITAQSFIYEVI